MAQRQEGVLDRLVGAVLADGLFGQHLTKQAHQIEGQHHANGQGELVIRYASLDQLDGIIARMKR